MTLELLELHDARLGEVCMMGDRNVVLRFAHVVAYERISEEVYDVVSYQAEISCEEVTDLHCYGAIEDQNKLSQWMIDDVEASSADESTLLHVGERAVSSVVLAFFGGTRLALKCRKIAFRLGNRGRVLERWMGPL